MWLKSKVKPIAKRFTVECYVKNIDRTFMGSGASRRKAEQAAAEKILQLLEMK